MCYGVLRCVRALLLKPPHTLNHTNTRNTPATTQRQRPKKRAAPSPSTAASTAAADGEVVEVSFEFRKRRFVFRPESNAFEHLKFPAHEPLRSYLAATGHGSAERVASATQRWGLNKFDVPLPAFSALLKEQMLAPFFVFQVFCVALWCLDEYWCASCVGCVLVGCVCVFGCVRACASLGGVRCGGRLGGGDACCWGLTASDDDEEGGDDTTKNT